MAHTMECFARLVRLLLGQDAMADRKLEFGKQLLVLGMQASVTLLLCLLPRVRIHVRLR